MRRNPLLDVTPSASRLTNSLRDIGYDFVSAVADIVDNSISAEARRIDIEIQFEGAASYVLIADDGMGMTDRELTEALRFGSRRDYFEDDLGRYGLGLKTASLSQCRSVTVASRRSPVRRWISSRTLDLDHIADSDRWELVDVPVESRSYRALEWLDYSTGTVVVWEDLDRVLPERRASGGWARRRLDSLAVKTVDHLGMVFHRFLEGVVKGRDRITITVNGRKVLPWNPFAEKEEVRQVLPQRQYELWAGDVTGVVTFSPVVLPPRTLFSSVAAFERLSGPAKWNRQQGFYIYRADRMIQSGGWCGLRAIDEHTKLARGALDFSPELDEVFRINVAKMRVSLPPELRPLIDPHATELCHRAQEMYRRDLREGLNGSADVAGPSVRREGSQSDSLEVGAAIVSAALATGTTAALKRMRNHLRRSAPDVIRSLGW